MTTANLVSDAADLARVLGMLNLSATVPPHLYLDLEGFNLCRHGSISLLTLYDRSQSCVYLIDIHTLGHATFEIRSTTNKKSLYQDIQAIDTDSSETDAGGVTLRSILESANIPKVFFDVRNDADALFNIYGINLQGVQDLQVMELATRGGGRNRERVNGLARCIQYGLVDVLTPLQRSQIQTIKARGAALFAPEKGGTFSVFNERPLDLVIEHYCIQDVVHMPALWNIYSKKLKIRFWRFVVAHETRKRLAESRSPEYVPQGDHKSLGWTWEYLRQLEREWNG